MTRSIDPASQTAPISSRGPWTATERQDFLHAAIIPLRLAVVRPDGMPLVLSLWFLPRADGELWCATRRKAHVVDVLRRNPRCGFEVASEIPPYKGVRGHGVATLDDAQGADVLGLLLDRYGMPRTGKLGRALLAHAEDETVVRISPQGMTSWDFTARMSETAAGAVAP